MTRRLGAASPGAYRVATERWGSFETLVRALPAGSLVILDRAVARLHPSTTRAIRATRPTAILAVGGGEGTKSVGCLEHALEAGSSLHRDGSLLAVGGGTTGDLGTVAAHLLRRGVRLVQVPTTLVAAVDSSLGGKGALNVRRDRSILRNAAGVFHYPSECWICLDLLSTLRPAQLREGRIEALKMFAAVSPRLWRRHRAEAHPPDELIRDARQVKAWVCRADPYDQLGRRAVLNFGHTFGHALETLSRLRLSHGDAVALGIVCALDIGRLAGATRKVDAWEIETTLAEISAPGRRDLATLLRGVGRAEVARILAVDKKARVPRELTMVLLRRIGMPSIAQVSAPLWHRALAWWRRGVRPR